MNEDTKACAQEKMDKAITALKNEFARVRTGRASTALLDHIMVDYYGTPTRLNQLATLSVPESRMITIQPWDATALKSIEKAILKSDLGLTPSNDGKIIRMTIPELTEERRREIVKIIKHVTEECRISIRQIRKEANDQLKKMEKEKAITEDEHRRIQDEIQKMTDKTIQQADQILEKKEAEVMQI
ncbi:MAG: ribosome recycling factor [Nitrospirae bacterium CG_4_9_14_3_um_filter_53_35]|nr:MAG: ribosome recycling factor [Nitrospirae bacterium CG2_30_53_67]PIS38365.1 MAG: ribosome recycling factor [Nitrospirae bacterium CG08_land_8_20_14_0_20_52_24]PIV82632.1 MAG: ribosome recycling factor [Nitrospirae bacterium CG17_big_fil_post_rev_8_21_14_2_50_50_9]PIW84326.1 MAG: ribosome recycling factor [Nitrospirae bacterium CG_4_8_14_3_um_filter_50_41]PIX86013.1 MAG: ribosome recycling factor [Nitrospirae bacterium CG_4_10_14_3_um_filter_53_41]PJA73067.1 MAG: ribosome recycling factor 